MKDMRHKKYILPTEGLLVCPNDKIPVNGLDKIAGRREQGEFGGLRNGWENSLTLQWQVPVTHVWHDLLDAQQTGALVSHVDSG